MSFQAVFIPNKPCILLNNCVIPLIVLQHDCFVFLIRIRLLFNKSKVPVPHKSVVKDQAKLCKKFLVLVKRKLQRDQLCRGKLFRRLLALVHNPDLQDPLIFIKCVGSKI